jgi:hypothetical protein
MNSSYELPLDYAHTARFYILCLKQFLSGQILVRPNSYPAMADGAAVNNNPGHDGPATNRRRYRGQPAIAPISPLTHKALID